MLDYKTLKNWGRRPNKDVGVKIATWVYAKYDDSRDCFVVSQIWQRSDWVGDKRVPRKRKDWDVRPYAEVYRDRIVILRVMGNSYLKHFNLESYATTSNQTLGRRYILNNCQALILEPPFMIHNGNLEPIEPPKQRVFNKEKQKAFNAEIKRVRRILMVRDKLGIFDSWNVHAHVSAMREQYGGVYMQTPEQLVAHLNRVSESDLATLHPLLWVIHIHNGNTWTQRFDNFIARNKEQLRQYLGVVEYI